MDDTFLIYLDRLQDGKEQLLDSDVESEKIFTEEKDLKFGSLTQIRGKAYLASDHLVLEVSASVHLSMPCIICNTFVCFLLTMDKQTLTIPVEQIKQRVYNIKDVIYGSLLLQVPQTKECEGGCNQREVLKPYLKAASDDLSKHYPFSGLE